jgi:hypothetical protein
MQISNDESAMIILRATTSEVASNHNHTFMINKNEYQSLQKWDLWKEDGQ